MSSRVWHRFKQYKLACTGLILIISWMLIGLWTPAIVPHDPAAQVFSRRYQPPSWNHLCGTDQFGRDVLSRLLAGSTISLRLGLAVTTMALIIGTTFGALAGYLGGKFDRAIMSGVDLLLSFPLIYLLVSCVALLGTSLGTLVLVMALTSWMDIARLVRAEILSLKEREFIKAAQILGYSRSRIIFRHLLPNALSPIIAFAALRLADVILIESSLSFLGLGVQPPSVSWGSIIRDGRDMIAGAWWIVTFPGLAIMLTCVSLNWIGEGLRKSF